MPSDPRILEIIQTWWTSAVGDLNVAKSAMHTPFASCFHSQQAVEKAIKCLLVYNQIDFEKIHDIGRLLDLLEGASVVAPASASSGIKELSRFAVETRYPPGNATLEEAKDALAKAERFLLWVRRQLPKKSERNYKRS